MKFTYTLIYIYIYIFIYYFDIHVSSKELHLEPWMFGLDLPRGMG